MKLQILFLLGAIIFGVNFVQAQSDRNAKDLYYGYTPRNERRNTTRQTTTTQTTSTRQTTATTTNRRNNRNNRNTNASTNNTNQRRNTQNSGGNSSGISPTATGLPGTKMTIELMRNGKLSFVKPTFTFKSGDKIRIRLKTNFEGYVSVLNLGSSGKVNLLYPVQGRDNYVTPTADYQIPQGNGWIIFDDTPGTEVISVIMSEDKLEGLADLDRNSEYFTKNRTSKDLFVQTSGNDYYAVFREQEAGRNVGFSFKLKHRK